MARWHIGQHAQPTKWVDALIGFEHIGRNGLARHAMKTIATRNKITIQTVSFTVFFIRHIRRIAIDIVQGHIAGIVNRGGADLGTRLHQVTRHLGLAIYRHMAADQSFKIHAVFFAVKHEFTTIVRYAFFNQILGNACTLQAVYSHAFQHPCTDAAQHIIAVFAFQNDIINATFGQNLSQ